LLVKDGWRIARLWKSNARFVMNGTKYLLYLNTLTHYAQQPNKEHYKFITMEITRNQILNYINNCENKHELLTYLELSADKLEINTISEMARLENKSPNGIRESNNYYKVRLGKQLMCFKGLKDNDMEWL
jgi:hypothetical protein